MSQRQQVVEAVADRIASLRAAGVIFVAIDGVDGAGKSIFGDELAGALRARGRPVIRASVDSFHNTRAIRYRRGHQSPDGFFLDSFDYPGLRQALFDPLRTAAPYRTKIHDLVSDEMLAEPPQCAAPDSILVFDGIFLHRPELREYWECSIFLSVDLTVSVARCAERDRTSPDVEAAENRRYVEAQRRYLRECAPSRHATITIDNNDLAAPRIVIDRATGESVEGSVRP
ncbi:MAG: uridine kinase [Alphaproteobacteria bacterium]|nr:MAG: uridine kinase [Alphaproteobacteria bacterium]